MHENRALSSLFCEERLKEKWNGHFSNIKNSSKVVKDLVQIALTSNLSTYLNLILPAF